MALLPSFILISGAITIVLLRGRRTRTVYLVSAGIALAAVMTLSRQSPTVTTIALWRPIGLFGSGFRFSIEEGVWPFLLLASAVVLAEALLDGRSSISLLYAGIALAAIAGGNLLTIAMLWSLMILIETALRLRNLTEIDTALQMAGIQFAAVAAILAAASLETGAASLMALAALIRSIGGADKRFPFGLAVMAPLGAFAAISRSPAPASLLLWIAAGAIAVALVQSLIFKPRLGSLALALAAAGLLVPPQAQTAAWITIAAVLVGTLGLNRAGASRIAWGAVAIVPFTFFLGPLDLELLLLASLVTTTLAIISRWQPRSSRSWPSRRVEVVAIAVLMATAVLAPLSSGWLPNIGGAIAAVAGLAAGYAIARARPVLSQAQLPTRRLLEEAREAGQIISDFLAASVRTIADVLEGESAVLWILLVLLVVIIGLQVVIA